MQADEVDLVRLVVEGEQPIQQQGYTAPRPRPEETLTAVNEE